MNLEIEVSLNRKRRIWVLEDESRVVFEYLSIAARENNSSVSSIMEELENGAVIRVEFYECRIRKGYREWIEDIEKEYIDVPGGNTGLSELIGKNRLWRRRRKL